MCIFFCKFLDIILLLHSLKKPDPGSGRQSQALCKFVHVDALHVEHLLVLHQEDALDVAVEGSLRGLLEVSVPGEQGGDLAGDGLHLDGVDLNLLHGDPRGLELPHHGGLLRAGHHQQRLAPGLVTRGASRAMSVWTLVK